MLVIIKRKTRGCLKKEKIFLFFFDSTKISSVLDHGTPTVKCIKTFTAVAILTNISISFAEQQDPPTGIQFGLNSLYESNVFKISDAADSIQTLGSSHKDDIVKNPNISGRYNFKVGHQQLYIDGGVSPKYYEYHPNMNYIGHSTKIGSELIFSNAFVGDLSFETKKDISSFEDYLASTKDMLDNQKYSFNSTYTLANKVQLVNGFSSSKNIHSHNEELDLINTSYYFGVQYLTTNDNIFGVKYQNSDIEYNNSYYYVDAQNMIVHLNADDRGFNQSQNILYLIYKINSNISTEFNLGKTDSKYEYMDDNIISDFESIRIKVKSSYKTSFDIFYSTQDTIPISSINTSQKKLLSTGFKYDFSEKSSLRVDYSIDRQEYNDFQNRDDLTKIYKLSFFTKPFTRWGLEFNLFKDNRNSNISNYIYHDDGLSFNIKYKL